MTEMCATKLHECTENLHKWASEAGVELVKVEGECDSWYEPDNNRIVIGTGWDGMDDDPFTIGHEYGHSIFRAVLDRFNETPDCSQIVDECEAIKKKWVSQQQHMPCPAKNPAPIALRCVAPIHMGLNRKGYDISCTDLGAISDFVCMYLDEKLKNYPCHPQGYAKTFAEADAYGDGINHIYEDEWFANISGLLYENNWNALRAIHEVYPVALCSCIPIFDKAMKILLGREMKAE